MVFEMRKWWLEPHFDRVNFTAMYSSEAKSQVRYGLGCAFLVVSYVNPTRISLGQKRRTLGFT